MGESRRLKIPALQSTEAVNYHQIKTNN
jgi:hypothetical protein